MFALGLHLVSGSVSLLGFRSFPIFFFSFVNRLFGTWEDFRAFVCFPFSPALCNWFVHFVWNALGQRGSVGIRLGPVASVAFRGLQPPSV